MTRINQVATGIRAARVLLPHMIRSRSGSSVATVQVAAEQATRQRDQELERVAQTLLKADVVSFDLFDTLVTRTLRRPEDIHDVVARRAELEGLIVSGWRPMREAAEVHARRTSDVADVTLADIYGACGAMLPIDVLTRLSELEIEAELAVAVATRRGKLLFERARTAGKTIVVTSDMYLPKPVLEQMLAGCGFAGWDLLIVSGADGVSKRSGSAYAFLRSRFAGRSVAHVGDNLQHDVANALRASVRGVHLESPADHAARWSRYLPTTKRRASIPVDPVSASLAEGLFVNRVEHATAAPNAFEQAGYALLGPCLLGFARALQQTATERGATELFFLAREGRILQRAYLAGVPRDEQLRSVYALLSSRVTSMAVLGPDLSPDDLRFLVKTPVPLPARAFLTRVLGVSETSEIDATLLRHGVPPDRRLDQGEALATLAAVFREWAPALHGVASVQRGLLERYLRDVGMLAADHRPMLVDVGWSGTIQRALGTVRGSALDGFYLGLLDDQRTRSTPGLHAWIDARRSTDEAAELAAIFDGLRVLEVLFAAADEGSTRAFEEATDTKDTPVSTHLAVEFPTWTATLIDEAQEEAIAFIGDYHRNWSRLGLPDGAPVAALGRDALLQLMTWPTRAQLDDFATLPFDGTYGEKPGMVGAWGVPGELVARMNLHRLVRGLQRRGARLASAVPRRGDPEARTRPTDLPGDPSNGTSSA